MALYLKAIGLDPTFVVFATSIFHKDIWSI